MARQPGQAGHQLPQRDPGTRTPALADRPQEGGVRSSQLTGRPRYGREDWRRLPEQS